MQSLSLHGAAAAEVLEVFVLGEIGLVRRAGDEGPVHGLQHVVAVRLIARHDADIPVMSVGERFNGHNTCLALISGKHLLKIHDDLLKSLGFYSPKTDSLERMPSCRLISTPSRSA